MIHKVGTRFNSGDYFYMEIDTELPSCEVVGTINGEPVSFPDVAKVKKITGVQSADGSTLVFTGLESEPAMISVLLDASYTLAAGKKIIAFNNATDAILVTTTTSISKLARVSGGTERLTYSYSEGTLTLTVVDSTSLGAFLTGTNYSLSYAY